MNRSRWITRLALLAIAGMLIAGCFNPFDPRELGRSKSTPPPLPTTYTGVLQLFAWAYNNKDISQYGTVFTDDYRFAFAATDTSGNRYRDTPWTRVDELESARKLFDAASTISLQLDNNFVAFNDTRPGKLDPLRRKNVRTAVTLNISLLDGSQTNVSGKANFFLVRGDIAAIPPALGFPADSNRWYIERWEDETFAGALMSGALARLDASGRVRSPAAATARVARPASTGMGPEDWTWGHLKVVFR